MKPRPRPLSRPIYWDAVFAFIGIALAAVFVAQVVIWAAKRWA